MIYCERHLLNNLNVKVYLNGVLISNIDYSSNFHTMFTDTFHQSYLANNQTHTQALNGYFYEFLL